MRRSLEAIRHLEAAVLGADVADDDPAPASVWLPELARVLRARASRVPSHA
jgi:hypothetical protein